MLADLHDFAEFISVLMAPSSQGRVLATIKSLLSFAKVSQVNRIVTKAAKDAQIDRAVSPHWLRHAHASHAHARKTDLALIRDTLRHSSIATTGRYLHARPNDSSALHLGL